MLAVVGCTSRPDPSLFAADLADPARVAAWRADLQALLDGILARHPDPWRRCALVEFEAARESLARRVATTSNEPLVVAMAQLVARLQDGHTALVLDSWSSAPARLPLQIAWCDDGPFVAAIDEANREWLGSRVVGVGALSFDRAVAAVTSTTAIDNEPALRAFATGLLNDVRVLHATGVVPRRDGAAIRLLAADGGERSVELAVAGSATKWATLPAAADVPPTLRRRDAWFWWQPLPESGAVYLRGDRCAKGPPAGEEFAAVVADVDAYLRSHPKTRVIFDLRANPGGNDKVLAPMYGLARDHPFLQQRGNLLVLVGRRTFSSAGLVALWLRERHGAVLVGNPTGMKPNCFGEVRDFTLPHSRITVHCSTKEFRFVDGDPPSVEPDVSVPLVSTDVFSGRDVVLAAALAVPSGR